MRYSKWGENCDIENLTWILGCKIRILLTTYLGMPLGASYKLKRIWEPVIDRISARLDLWKAPLLSKGGLPDLGQGNLSSHA